VCVERRPADVGTVEQVLDGDGVVALLEHQLDEGTDQCLPGPPHPAVIVGRRLPGLGEPQNNPARSVRK